LGGVDSGAGVQSGELQSFMHASCDAYTARGICAGTGWSGVQALSVAAATPAASLARRGRAPWPKRLRIMAAQ
jgi:hypothetical protein